MGSVHTAAVVLDEGRGPCPGGSKDPKEVPEGSPERPPHLDVGAEN